MPVPLARLDSGIIVRELHSLLERGIPIPPVVVNYGTMYMGSGNVGNLTYSNSYQMINQSQPELAQLLVELARYSDLKETVDELANTLAEASSPGRDLQERKSIMLKVSEQLKNVSTIVGTVKELAPQVQELYHKVQPLISTFCKAHGVDI